MSIEIRSVSPDRKELKKYVKFGIDLYRGNDCYVPPLIFEEIETLMPSKNPAFDFARRSRLWLCATESRLGV